MNILQFIRKKFRGINKNDSGIVKYEAPQKPLDSDPELLIADAEAAMRQFDYVRALEKWAKVRERFPENPAGYSRAAAACRELRDFAQAEELCLLGMKMAPAAIEPLINYAEVAMRQFDYVKALERWAKVREKFPKRQAGYSRAAVASRELRDFTQAEELCLLGMKMAPAAVEPLIEYAEVAMRQGEYAIALERWAKVREKFPKRQAGYSRAAAACRELRDYAQAEQLCLQGMKMAPKAAEPLINYAEVAMRQGDFDKALERWAKVREKFPRHPAGYSRAVAACNELRYFQQAENISLQGMKTIPKAAEPLISYAEVAMRQGDYDQALERWAMVREKFPRHPAGYSRAVYACRELRDYQQADAFCLRGMKVAPLSIDLAINYAENAMRQYDFNTALQRWDMVIKKFPGSSTGYCGLIRTCNIMKKYDLMEQYAQEGLKNSFTPILIDCCLVNCYVQNSDINIKLKSVDIFKRIYDKNRDLFYLKIRENLMYLGYHNGVIYKYDSIKILVSLLLKEKLQYKKLPVLFSIVIKLGGENRENLFKLIDEIAEKENINSEIAIVLGNEKSDDDIRNAYLRIIKYTGLIRPLMLTYDIRFNRKNIIYELAQAIVGGYKFDEISDVDPLQIAMLIAYARIDPQPYVKMVLEDNKSSYPKTVDIFKFRSIYYDILRKVNIVKSSKLHIAVCVSGQIRGGYEEAFDSWKRALKLEQYDTTIFVSTWNKRGIFFPGPAHAARVFSGHFLGAFCIVSRRLNLRQFLENIYPNFYKLLTYCSPITKKELSDVYHTDHIFIEDEVNFDKFDNADKLYYKMDALYAMAMANHRYFDLMIRIRPDLRFNDDVNIDLNEVYEKSLKNKSIFVNDSNYRDAWLPFGYTINDTFGVGIPDVMKYYFNIFRDHGMYIPGCFPGNSRLFGHVAYQSQLFAYGVNVDYFAAGAKMLSHPHFSKKELYEALLKDVSTREPSNEDKILLEACERDLMN